MQPGGIGGAVIYGTLAGTRRGWQKEEHKQLRSWLHAIRAGTRLSHWRCGTATSGGRRRCFQRETMGEGEQERGQLSVENRE